MGSDEAAKVDAEASRSLDSAFGFGGLVERLDEGRLGLELEFRDDAEVLCIMTLPFFHPVLPFPLSTLLP